MLRQTTQKITALYPRLSHEDELQGESNSISTRSVFLKPTQSRTVFPICAGTRTMVILVRTSKDRAFNPCLRILKPGKWLLLS